VQSRGPNRDFCFTRSPVNGGDGSFGLTQHRQNAAGLNPLIVTDSLGSSVTVPVVVSLKY
jgi:hypothetical protein